MSVGYLKVAMGEIKYEATGGPNVGVIAGACVGAVAFAALVIVIILLTCRLTKRSVRTDRMLKEKGKELDSGFKNPTFTDSETVTVHFGEKTKKETGKKQKKLDQTQLDIAQFPEIKTHQDELQCGGEEQEEAARYEVLGSVTNPGYTSLEYLADKNNKEDNRAG